MAKTDHHHTDIEECEEETGSCVEDALPTEQRASSPTGPLDVQAEIWQRALVLLEPAPEGQRELRLDQKEGVLEVNHSSLGMVLRIAVNSIGQVLKNDLNPRRGCRVPQNASNDDSNLALILSRSELELVEKVLYESLELPEILEELKARRAADESGGKLARAGRLRDAARAMGWLLPKGRRAPVHDRADIVRGYSILTTRNTEKARRYFEQTHQLTETEAQEQVPTAPLHPWEALELLTKFHGFRNPEALHIFLRRAKRAIEEERRKPDGDPAICDLPDFPIPASTKPKNLR